MLKSILISYLVILVILIPICIFVLFKNENTFIQRGKIIHAIHDYYVDCIWKDKARMVDFDDMEDYDLTLYRFWDWGCKNILPKEKYEIIKPYIK